MPDNWNHANSNCAGKLQSPINIVTRKTLKDERLTPFKFNSYQESFRSMIKNNGHSGGHMSPLKHQVASHSFGAVALNVIMVCLLSSWSWDSSCEEHLWRKPAHQLQGCAVPPALGQQRRTRLWTHHRRGAVSHGGTLRRTYNVQITKHVCDMSCWHACDELESWEITYSENNRYLKCQRLNPFFFYM